jgi:hypothetical protein
MKVLVVPTNREEGIKSFLNAWEKPDWDKIIVVEDNPTKSFDLGLEHHYSWKDIEADLKENSWIISKKDSAIRCYGFLVAYRMGAEYIFSLDDDCHPDGDDLWCESHIKRMSQTPLWVGSVLGQRTRGIPYENIGLLQNVMFNVGLWTGIPDYDSVQSLSIGKMNQNYKPPNSDRIIPSGQYFPFCGMNFAFHHKAIPLCYFPLMGESSPYGRFDDIWFGIIAKKVCDHLGWHISVGQPYVKHIRLSDKFSNLVKESPGIELNETFWEIVDNVNLSSSTAMECMREVACKLDHQSSYIIQLGLAIKTWCNLVEEVENERKHVCRSSSG